jgi:hypothetical protein
LVTGLPVPEQAVEIGRAGDRAWRHAEWNNSIPPYPRELTRRFAGLAGALNPARKGAAARVQPAADEHADEQSIFATLPGTSAQIEARVEHGTRFEAYLDEVRTMTRRRTACRRCSTPARSSRLPSGRLRSVN